MFAEEKTDVSNKKQPRIMIVDDNVSNTLLITRILKFHGYENVVSITDASEVVDRFKAWQPDIILLDLLMPKLNGLEVLDQINSIKNQQYLPVIMITADNSEENRIKALKIGANDYISKPFNANELIARVENLIKVKESMDQALATETAFLQAQIKPHFLYNTLNTISSFCDTNPERASCLIDDFARYLRQSFDFKSMELFVPAEREIELVKSYVGIQQARFGNRIEFKLVVSSGLDFMLPPLCIQPLVENAIQHGLKENDDICVTVVIEKRQGRFEISVTDNGNGIRQKLLSDILLRSEKKGIGLWNIDTRLKKFYGRGLEVQSVEGQGVRVSFEIPEEKNEARNHC